jgi:hypothetical protein
MRKTIEISTASQPRSLSTNPKFLEIIEKAREEFRTGKTLSLEEIKRAVLE